MLTYHNTQPEELDRLKQWVASDPYHKDLLKGEFWIPKPGEKGIKYLTVSDENGIVFNLKLVNAMRVYVQFSPESQPDRIKNALTEAFGFISAGAKRLGYHEMLFDSIARPLIRFFSKFGFKPIQDTYSVKLGDSHAA